MFYENVPESFQLGIDCDEQELQELKPALEKIVEIEGGALFGQLVVSENQSCFSLEGAWFPPEFADKLAAVINEWRASRGIPVKEQDHV